MSDLNLEGNKKLMIILRFHQYWHRYIVGIVGDIGIVATSIGSLYNFSYTHEGRKYFIDGKFSGLNYNIIIIIIIMVKY